MNDAITDVPGILVGHAQDFEGCTGCTVVLCGQGASAGVDVRGGAPGTRETDCLDPSNTITKAHGIYLSGGSAFGLAGATGVVQWLEERKIGFDVGCTVVPIVPGAVIFDLKVGSHLARPDAAMGYQACVNAATGPVARGSVGAGTGAAVGKVAGTDRMMKGGIGTASRKIGSLVVGAIVVVNCFGDVKDPQSGEFLAGTLDASGKGYANSLETFVAAQGDISAFATTIGVVAVNARLDKAQARRIAIMTHDGYARSIDPVHTMYDGDTVFCLATGELEADVTLIGAVAAQVMARAVANAVLSAKSLAGVPGYEEIRARMVYSPLPDSVASDPRCLLN